MNIVGGVIVGVVLLLLPFIAKFLSGLSRDVHELKVAVVGDPKYGIRGLVKIVDDLVGTADLTQRGTAALIRDSKPDSGTTSRDVLDRIDEATKPSPTGNP